AGADDEVADTVGREVDTDGVERSAGTDDNPRRPGPAAKPAAGPVERDRVARGKAHGTVDRQRRGRLEQDGDTCTDAHRRARADREVARKHIAEGGRVGADGVEG